MRASARRIVRLELRENSVLFLPVRSEKPSERIERELLDRRDGESARPFAGPVSAHTVGYQKEVCPLLSNL
jgi:hypothetical protein